MVKLTLGVPLTSNPFCIVGIFVYKKIFEIIKIYVIFIQLTKLSIRNNIKIIELNIINFNITYLHA